MIVNLSSSATKIIVPQQTVSFSSLTITSMVDLPSQYCVKIFTKELYKPIILWSGQTAYNAIGQWTNEDVVYAIQQMFP